MPVIGYGTNELPAFYTRKSGFGVDYELDTPEELAAAFHAERELGMKNGMLVTNPHPEKYSMDHKVIDKAIEQALAEAGRAGHHGKGDHALPAGQGEGSHRRRQPGEQHPAGATTPFLGAKTACALAALKGADAGAAGGLSDWLGVYLLVINAAAFAVYGADKRRAKQGRWRVPEKNIVSAGHRGRQRGGLCWGCDLSPQDPTLVLPLWHPGYSGGAAGAGGLAVAALNEHPKSNKDPH